ncbi:cytochrome b5-like protein [Lentzea flaviverrucosa]|uniref:Cytochrome b5-like Heme/Steroid binding domain-containing protein n=2 Tax=Lentzea flaviverrucosa TaxID=200379 RepID=A0A1H9BHC9_9PSEU|nr:cytochrome b5-like protein [Lentzea flaviverrucosa]SEP88305.1 Cytochrome b5-like Heme/Steroid binding domain-containing protein [Lentzea flaviverrucosa]
MSMEDVLEKSDKSCPLIVVDNQVVDLSEFLRWHPGGLAVLLANLGRDASADFHHVSAHARPGVRKKLRQLVVAEIDDVPLPEAWISLAELLDYVRLVRNSFAVQFDTERNPVHDLIYLGQSCCHMLDDHVRALLLRFSALLDRTADPVLLQQLDNLSTDAQALVEVSLAKADAITAASHARWIQQHCVTLLDDVLACSTAAARALRTSRAETAHHVEQAISLIEHWIHNTTEAMRNDA